MGKVHILHELDLDESTQYTDFSSQECKIAAPGEIAPACKIAPPITPLTTTPSREKADPSRKVIPLVEFAPTCSSPTSKK